ncbi:MAG: TerB family tellurite resistance protein [Allomuricauda sp.]|nr:MAG: TerB family tellurite resistance protein [Allomuricauda sp.]
MSTHEEKLSMLSQMISFAQEDNVLKLSEYYFLLSVASSLGVEKDAFDRLLQDRPENKIPQTQAERIVQFHRLVLLMNIDGEQHPSEIGKLHNMGLWMGLPPSAIGQVLEVMHQYPNKVVPPDVLLKIFTAHYN